MLFYNKGKQSLTPKLTINQISGGIFFIFALIPYVHFSMNTMDSQIWPGGIALLYIMINKGALRVPPFLLPSFLITITGYLITILVSHDPTPYLLARYTYGYISIFLFYLVFYDYISRYGIPISLILIVNLMWLLMALVEIYYPEVSIAFSIQRTNYQRGVTSLAPEPTAFSLFLLLLSWVSLLYYKYKPPLYVKLILLFNALSIVFLAKSSGGTLFLFISVLIMSAYVLKELKIFKIIILVTIFTMITVFLFGGIVDKSLENSRLLILLTEVKINSIINIVRDDISINTRLAHIILPLTSAAYHYFLPAGLDTFGIVFNDLAQYYGLFFEKSFHPDEPFPHAIEGGKGYISNWIGNFVHHLGIFGIISLTLLFLSIYTRTFQNYLEIIALTILLVPETPLSLPIIPLIFAIMAIRKNKIYRSKSTQEL